MGDLSDRQSNSGVVESMKTLKAGLKAGKKGGLRGSTRAGSEKRSRTYVEKSAREARVAGATAFASPATCSSSCPVAGRLLEKFCPLALDPRRSVTLAASTCVPPVKAAAPRLKVVGTCWLADLGHFATIDVYKRGHRRIASLTLGKFKSVRAAVEEATAKAALLGWKVSEWRDGLGNVFTPCLK